MGRLDNKVIVISGGTKGVGRAFAEVAGQEGAKNGEGSHQKYQNLWV